MTALQALYCGEAPPRDDGQARSMSADEQFGRTFLEIHAAVIQNNGRPPNEPARGTGDNGGPVNPGTGCRTEKRAGDVGAGLAKVHPKRFRCRVAFCVARPRNHTGQEGARPAWRELGIEPTITVQ